MIFTMVPLRIRLFILLSLPLTTLCRMYKVVKEPAEADLCLIFTVANGGNETQDDDGTHGSIGRFDWRQKKCIWANNIETDEDRCDPDLSKEAYTERMVRDIRQWLIKLYGMDPVIIIRQPDKTAVTEMQPLREWEAFDDAIDKVIENCHGKRGLILDFIARDRDQDADLITLGYLITGIELKDNNDKQLSKLVDKSAIRAMKYYEHITLESLLRGASSLGRYLSDEFDGSAKIVPSPKFPKPEEGKETEPFYYSGGATVKWYGSRSGDSNVDAILVAIPEYLMMGEAKRQHTSKKMATGIKEYMHAVLLHNDIQDRH